MDCDTFYDPLIQTDVALLVCKERCQHRICQKCEAPIHRGSKDDPAYYDNNGNATCHVVQHFGWEEMVGHQP